VRAAQSVNNFGLDAYQSQTLSRDLLGCGCLANGAVGIQISLYRHNRNLTGRGTFSGSRLRPLKTLC